MTTLPGWGDAAYLFVASKKRTPRSARGEERDGLPGEENLKDRTKKKAQVLAVLDGVTDHEVRRTGKRTCPPSPS